ncbi:hypothetical protein, partial [Mesorhizobium sp. BR1-1-2]|uniref:hypothetical protein n=1 Tax=Mesorhizobium sp. BR1-1-2 TaxID=2876652 RepID=UPI001CC99972
STPPAKRKVLPMCPVRFVTYVSGRSPHSFDAVGKSGLTEEFGEASCDFHLNSTEPRRISKNGNGVDRVSHRLCSFGIMICGGKRWRL